MKLISFPVEVALRLLKCGKAPIADFVRLLTQEIDVGEMSERGLADALQITPHQARQTLADFRRFQAAIKQQSSKPSLNISELGGTNQAAIKQQSSSGKETPLLSPTPPINPKENYSRCEDAHMREALTFYEELKTDNAKEFWQAMAMGLHIGIERIKELLEDFENESRAKQAVHQTRRDYRQHFYDWARIQVEKQRKQEQQNEILRQRDRNRHSTLDFGATKTEDYADTRF